MRRTLSEKIPRETLRLVHTSESEVGFKAQARKLVHPPIRNVRKFDSWQSDTESDTGRAELRRISDYSVSALDVVFPRKSAGIEWTRKTPELGVNETLYH